MWILGLLAAFGISLWLVLMQQARQKAEARRRFISAPFPPEWEQVLKRDMPQYGRLADGLREQLQRYIKEFIYDKSFEGCGGLAVTDEMKVVVAAEACMLLLNRDMPCYPRLRTILLYPSAYVARGDRFSESGESVRLGESWGIGNVVLAWDSVKRGALNVQDGHNVAMHEFAHQLDQEDGASDGAPLMQRSAYSQWARILGHDFEELKEELESGRRDVIDEYGATNPAEFFAVATETFFEQPEKLSVRHPELFEQLKGYYRVDPRDWT